MNDRLKDQALMMLNIMVEKIKEGEEAGEYGTDIRTFRAAGANFILYYLDILSFEEHEEFDRKIFHPFD